MLNLKLCEGRNHSENILRNKSPAAGAVKMTSLCFSDGLRQSNYRQEGLLSEAMWTHESCCPRWCAFTSNCSLITYSVLTEEEVKFANQLQVVTIFYFFVIVWKLQCICKLLFGSLKNSLNCSSGTYWGCFGNKTRSLYVISVRTRLWIFTENSHNERKWWILAR